MQAVPYIDAVALPLDRWGEAVDSPADTVRRTKAGPVSAADNMAAAVVVVGSRVAAAAVAADLGGQAGGGVRAGLVGVAQTPPGDGTGVPLQTRTGASTTVGLEPVMHLRER